MRRGYAIGDSVMQAAKDHLVGNGVVVDARVGRFAFEGLKILRTAALPDHVAFHLGTNGGLRLDQLDQLYSIVGERRHLTLVTVKGPLRWRSITNRRIRAFAVHKPNVVVLEWGRIGGKHDEWFWDDGIHLRPLGAQKYAALLTRAMFL